MLTKKLFTKEDMGRVKINFVDVSDKCEYWKGNVWNQFLVSFLLHGVSIFHNKRTHSELGTPPFARFPHQGDTGGLFPDLFSLPKWWKLQFTTLSSGISPLFCFKITKFLFINYMHSHLYIILFFMTFGHSKFQNNINVFINWVS